MSNKATCETCKFWVGHGVVPSRECARYPEIHFDHITDATDWCGEWQPMVERDHTQQCATCAFWDIDALEEGKRPYCRCRRFPPREGGTTTGPAEWCGEWRQRREVKR